MSTNKNNNSQSITINNAPAKAEDANRMLFDILNSYKRENRALADQVALLKEINHNLIKERDKLKLINQINMA